jgi:uncharacterized protein
VRRWLRRLLLGARDVWERAKNERASPGQIGWAVGVGVFAGCTPLLGLHGWVALGLATFARLNRLWAWIGSRVSNMVILPWIALGEIQSAHWLRTGKLVPLTARDALREGATLLLDWCIGSLLVGSALGLVLGLVAYAYARRRARALDATRPGGPQATPS